MIDNNWKQKIRVKPLDDGNMGSLELFINTNFKQNRIVGKQIAECYFFDIDNIKVIASLNIDNNGDLYELDIWKTDFSPLSEIPKYVNQFFHT